MNREIYGDVLHYYCLHLLQAVNKSPRTVATACFNIKTEALYLNIKQEVHIFLLS